MDSSDKSSEDEFAMVIEEVTTTLRLLTAELSLVRGVCDAIGTAQSMPELCTMLGWPLAHAVDSRCVSIFWDDGDIPFRLQSLWSSPPLTEVFPSTLVGSRIVDTLRESRGPILIGDLSAYRTLHEAWPFPMTYVSYLLVPLIANGRLRGILCFCDDRPNVFDEKKFLTVMRVVPPIAETLSRITRED